MISQFFIMSARGDSLIFKDYRGDVPATTREKFWRKVKYTDEGHAPPVFCIEGINYIHVKKAGMYLVLITRYNQSPCMGLELLERLARLVKDYAGQINEDTVRRNFVLIYEILDEVMDYGYPQATQTDVVKVYIFNTPALVEDNALEFISSKIENAGAKVLSKIGQHKSSIDASAVRRPVGVGVQKGQNEVFLDVLERVTMTFDVSSSDRPKILNAEINGSILLKSYLSGSPEISLALNEDLVVGSKGATHGRVNLVYANFDNAVRLDLWEKQRVLLIYPPDGEVTLMNYRITDTFHPPFRIYPFIDEQSANRIEVTIKVKAEYGAPHFGNNVIIKCPMPRSCGSVSGQLPVDAVGESYEYKGPENMMYWFIKKFEGAGSGKEEHSFKIKMVRYDLRIFSLQQCNAIQRVKQRMFARSASV